MTHENQCSRLWQAKKVQGLKGNDLWKFKLKNLASSKSSKYKICKFMVTLKRQNGGNNK
jgi:hypothetical protein